MPFRLQFLLRNALKMHFARFHSFEVSIWVKLDGSFEVSIWVSICVGANTLILFDFFAVDSEFL